MCRAKLQKSFAEFQKELQVGVFCVFTEIKTNRTKSWLEIRFLMTYFWKNLIFDCEFATIIKYVLLSQNIYFAYIYEWSTNIHFIKLQFQWKMPVFRSHVLCQRLGDIQQIHNKSLFKNRWNLKPHILNLYFLILFRILTYFISKTLNF